MKKFSVLLFGSLAIFGAIAQTSVGVSIGINQPGVYGRIDIGNYPPPLVINPQPVIIMQSPVVEPLYLYVPPGHQKHWDRHCREYRACDRPVYFVREEWVRDRYEERRRYESEGEDEHDHDHDRGHGNGNGRRKKFDD